MPSFSVAFWNFVVLVATPALLLWFLGRTAYLFYVQPWRRTVPGYITLSAAFGALLFSLSALGLTMALGLDVLGSVGLITVPSFLFLALIMGVRTGMKVDSKYY